MTVPQKKAIEKSVTAISTEVEFAKAILEQGSQQVTHDKTTGEMSPAIPFDAYITAYDSSYILGGIVDKVARTADSGFNIGTDEVTDGGKTKNPLLDILDDMDTEFLLVNLYLLNNSFFEVIRDAKTDKVIKLIPILANTIKCLKGGEWYVQKVGSRKAYFNSYMKKDDTTKKDAIARYEASKAKENELIGSEDGAGYNPKLNEVYQFKGMSLSNKYYGDSPVKKVLRQVILLANIDKFYNMIFENQNIRNKIFYSKEGKLTDKQRVELQTAITTALKWLDKAFKGLVLNGEIGSINLSEDLDDKAFLEKADRLEQAVCIGLNIPYDVLKSVNSNKASSTVAIKVMYSQLIKPLQKKVIQGLKTIFSDYENVEMLQFNTVDTQDMLDMVEAVTKLVDKDIITKYEARQDLGYAQREKETLDVFLDADTPVGATQDTKDALDQTADDVQKMYWKNGLEKEPTS